jgi:hypothetical protein
MVLTCDLKLNARNWVVTHGETEKSEEKIMDLRHWILAKNSVVKTVWKEIPLNFIVIRARTPQLSGVTYQKIALKSMVKFRRSSPAENSDEIYSGVRLDDSVAMARHKTFSLHADQKHHTKSFFLSRRWRLELARTPPSKRF